MSVNRRQFLFRGALAGVGLAALPTGRAGEAPAQPAAQPERRQAVLKISSQEGLVPGRNLAEKLDRMEAWGIEGLEIGGAIGRERALEEALRNRRVRVSAICMGSIGGRLVSGDAQQRDQAAEQFRRQLTAAGAVGSTGVIYVPCFNGEQKLPNQEVRRILLDVLPALGEHAVQANSRILLEPLNRGEAFFLRQLADAASIARDSRSPGVCVMGDFFHMNREETSDMGAFISAGSRLHHVHLASRERNLPGQDDRSFVEGFRGLKQIGYQDYCSFECGCRGQWEVEMPRSCAFLRQQWEQATI